ncbi:MAG: hypothetical protein PHE61_05245 [Candidatus Omnitrophica bacterium]|nr:hypothetical protein [Candidatus Omnitrophota bacterium]
MGKWSETGIGIIYFAGLTASLILALVALYCLRSKLERGLAAIAGRSHLKFWERLFKITLVFGTLAGALSATFYGCNGVADYNDLLSSRFATLNHGFTQVAYSAESLSRVLMLWLLFFCSYRLFGRKL